MTFYFTESCKKLENFLYKALYVRKASIKHNWRDYSKENFFVFFGILLCEVQAMIFCCKPGYFAVLLLSNVSFTDV